MKRTLVLLPSICLCWAWPAAAQVSAVNGTVANGQNITVTGSGFGSTGPTVVLFDDFEGGTAGQPVNLSAAQVGRWLNQKNYPIYDASVRRSGNLSMEFSNFIAKWPGTVPQCPGGTYCDSSSQYQALGAEMNATEVFWSFWRYMPEDNEIPCAGGNNINWKVTWILGSDFDVDNVQNDFFTPGFNEQHRNEGYDIEGTGSNATFMQLNCGQHQYPLYRVTWPVLGNWVRVQHYVRGAGDCSGRFMTWEIPFHNSGTNSPYGCVSTPTYDSDRNTCEMLRKDRPNITTRTCAISDRRGPNGLMCNSDSDCGRCVGGSSAGLPCSPTTNVFDWDRDCGTGTCQQVAGATCRLQPFHRFALNAYARNCNEAGGMPARESRPRYDDVYVATGPGALARVELANYPTWGDRAHGSDLNMTICTPTVWNSGSVTCTVRQGSFTAGQTVYLFVVDAAGNVSDQDPATPGAQGFAVRISGSSGDTNPPAAPQNVRVLP